MISKYIYKELNWIDLESPQEEELIHILEQYRIPSNIKDKILAKNLNETIDINDDSIVVFIKNSIIFIVNNNLVLTIHHKPIEAFDQFSKEMELDINGNKKISSHKLLFAYLLKNLYTSSQDQLINNENQIIKLKKKIKLNHRKNIQMLIVILILFISLILSIWL